VKKNKKTEAENLD